MGEVNTGSCGVAFTNGDRFFRVTLNDEMPAVDLATGKKTLLSIR